MNYGGELPGVRNIFYICFITSFPSHLHCACVGVLELQWQCQAQQQMVIAGQPLQCLFYCYFFILCTLFSTS